MSYDALPPVVEGNLNRIIQLLGIYAKLTTFEIKEGPEEKPRGAFRQDPKLGTKELEERIQGLVAETEEAQGQDVHHAHDPEGPSYVLDDPT